MNCDILIWYDFWNELCYFDMIWILKWIVICNLSGDIKIYDVLIVLIFVIQVVILWYCKICDICWNFCDIVRFVIQGQVCIICVNWRIFFYQSVLCPGLPTLDKAKKKKKEKGFVWGCQPRKRRKKKKALSGVGNLGQSTLGPKKIHLGKKIKHAPGLATPDKELHNKK